ncbi:hypothetical protein LINPERPRIM_LOCUS6755 [Linum perenne]
MLIIPLDPIRNHIIGVRKRSLGLIATELAKAYPDDFGDLPPSIKILQNQEVTFEVQFLRHIHINAYADIKISKIWGLKFHRAELCAQLPKSAPPYRSPSDDPSITTTLSFIAPSSKLKLSSDSPSLGLTPSLRPKPTLSKVQKEQASRFSKKSSPIAFVAVKSSGAQPAVAKLAPKTPIVGSSSLLSSLLASHQEATDQCSSIPMPLLDPFDDVPLSSFVRPKRPRVDVNTRGTRPPARSTPSEKITSSRYVSLPTHFLE